MESDLSLLGGDDSLHDVSNYGDREHLAKSSCSSQKDCSNKENINMNKLETPKLNMEPLQMKRKKKGGNYNLRKSLAWDRAFFTEEGVLDPVELSMITGTHVRSGGERLSAISEGESDSISSDCQFPNNSPNLLSHQRKKVPHKILTIHGGTGIGITAGDPRCLGSSSLKRPAILNAGRSVSKESKFLKTAVPKLSPFSAALTAKGPVPCGSTSKRNQIYQPAVKIQKRAESKIPTNVKSIPKVKAGSAAMPVKSSTNLHKVTSPVKISSSTSQRSHLVNKAVKTCLKENPKVVVPLGTSRSKEDRSTLVTASACQSTLTASSSLHLGQVQARKPSGLRKPSPSLGFFAQPKASASKNLTPLASGFTTPGLCKLPDPRPSQAPELKTMHEIMASFNARLLSCRAECSTTSDFIAVSHKTWKPASEQNTKNSLLKFPHDSKHADISSNELTPGEFHDANKKSEDYVKHYRDERTNINVTGLLEQTEAPEHLMEADEIKIKIHDFQSKDSSNSDGADSLLLPRKIFALDDTLGEERFCKSAVTNPDTIRLSSGGIDSGGEQNSLMVQSHKEMSSQSYITSSHHNGIAHYSGLGGNLVPNGGKPYLNAKQKNMSKVSEGEQFCGSVTTTSESCGNELQSSNILSQKKYTNFSIEAVARDEMTKSTSLKEQRLHASNEMLPSECHKHFLNPRVEAGELIEQSEKHLEAQSMYLGVEKSSHIDHLLHAGDSMLFEKQYQQVMEVISSTIPDGDNGDTSIDRLFQAPAEMHADGLENDRQILMSDKPPEPETTASLYKTGCLGNINLNRDDFLNGESTAAADFDSSLTEQSELVDEDSRIQLNCKDMRNMNTDGPNSDLQVEELGYQKFLDSLPKEHQNMEMDSSFFSRKSVPDESENELPNSSLIVQVHSEGEQKRCISLPHSINLVIENIEDQGDEIVQSTTCNVPANYCIKHCSLVHDSEKSEPQELVYPHLAATVDSLSSDRLQTEDHPQIGKYSISGNSMENNLSGSSEGPIALKVDVNKCEGSSSDVSQLLCFSEEAPSDSNKFLTDSVVEDRPSDFVYGEDSQSEVLVVDTSAEHNLQCGDIGLSTGENLERSQQGFDELKRNTSTNEEKRKSLHEIDFSAGEVQHESSSSPCSTTENNTIRPIENSQKDLNKNNVRITLPRDLIPFSEEWLAAMESAGEDILTLKTGPVQNSPPDKSLPEPSPWSPVRRRNNQKGPYDCTKFTNTMPSDPQ